MHTCALVENSTSVKNRQQVSFELALDSSRKLGRQFEAAETLISRATALYYYMPKENGCQELVESLMESMASELSLQDIEDTSFENSIFLGTATANVVKEEDKRVVANLLLSSPPPKKIIPVRREYILRCLAPRPFLNSIDDYYENEEHSTEEQRDEEGPLVVSRMYAAFENNTVRFAMTLSDSEC